MKQYFKILVFFCFCSSIFCQNPLTIKDSMVGVYNNNPKVSLDVNGDVRIEKKLIISKKITSKGVINSKKKIKQNGYDLLPEGAIIIWTEKNIPEGWVICDGENDKTPDLRGRFIIGVGKREGNNIGTDLKDYKREKYNYSFKDRGGSEKIKFKTSNLPKHTHEVTNIYNVKTHKKIEIDNDKGYRKGTKIKLITASQKTGKSGENKLQNNLPPYYVVKYIMKL